MKRFNTLWAKISFTVVLLIVAIMVLITYINIISQIKSQRIELQQNMGRIAKQIASIRLAETEGYYVYQDWIDNIINSDFGRDLVYIAIFDENDSLKAFTLNQSWLDLEGDTYLTRKEQEEIIIRLTNGHIADESKDDFGHIPVDIRWGSEYLGLVDVGFSLVEFNNEARKKLFLNLELLAIFSVLGVIGSVLLSRRITQPLDKLSQAMQSVSKGELDQKVEIKGNDEIVQLANSFNRMTKGLKEKAAIENLSKELNFNFEINKMCQLAADHLAAATGSSQLFVFLMNNDNQAILKASIPNIRDNTVQLEMDDEFQQKFIRKHILYSWTEKSLPQGISDFLIKMNVDLQSSPIVYLSLSNKDRLLGFVILNFSDKHFSVNHDEEQFWIILSTQIALAVENAILLESLKEQERIKREIEIARTVQKRLLPTKMPELNDFQISGICIPALEVGGDYFDFFDLGNQKLGIAIADVSGKGTSAAFYMAEIKGMMSSLAKYKQSPRDILCVINDHLYKTLDRNVFATMIYAVLDITKKQLTFVRAGHTGLMVKCSENQNNLDIHIPKGIGLGLIDSTVFDGVLEEQTLDLSQGDIVLFYTDGITEAMNGAFEEFGEQPLADILVNAQAESVHEIQNSILEHVYMFVDDAPQHDDLTMIALKAMK